MSANSVQAFRAETLITSDSKVVMGKPTITGTRITVDLILEKLAAGETVDQILSEYPRRGRERDKQIVERLRVDGHDVL